jgi:elongation factor Ts
MAAITANLVKELRIKTDAPMMECQKALKEADGDLAKAEEILRVRLGNKANKAASRIAAEGLISILIAPDLKSAAIAEVNCETDFVTKNDDFIALSKGIAKIVLEKNPADLTALGNEAYAGSTVEATRTALIGKIGENMTARRFIRLSSTNSFVSYEHNGRIGVLVEYSGDATAARDVAMQIAATKPVSLDVTGVPADIIEKERSVATQKALESGKPANIAEKMVEGSIQKFVKEVALMSQAFVKNDKQTIEQFLKEKNTQVHSFTLYVVGEGIEKKVNDFAAEVAAQAAAAKA